MDLVGTRVGIIMIDLQWSFEILIDDTSIFPGLPRETLKSVNSYREKPLTLHLA